LAITEARVVAMLMAMVKTMVVVKTMAVVVVKAKDDTSMRRSE